MASRARNETRARLAPVASTATGWEKRSAATPGAVVGASVGFVKTPMVASWAIPDAADLRARRTGVNLASPTRRSGGGRGLGRLLGRLRVPQAQRDRSPRGRGAGQTASRCPGDAENAMRSREP